MDDSILQNSQLSSTLSSSRPSLPSSSMSTQYPIPNKLGPLLKPDNRFTRAPNFEIGLSRTYGKVYFCLSKYKKDFVFQLAQKSKDGYYCAKCKLCQTLANGRFRIVGDKIVPDPDTVPHACLSKQSSLIDVISEQAFR